MIARAAGQTATAVFYGNRQSFVFVTAVTAKLLAEQNVCSNNQKY